MGVSPACRILVFLDILKALFLRVVVVLSEVSRFH